MKHNEYKQLLQLSLYGELNSEEQKLLKEHLLECIECQRELEDQKNLFEIISGKKKSNVDEKVLSAARYQLRGALRSENSNNISFQPFLVSIFEFFTTPVRFAAASITLMLIGILIGGLFFGKSSASETTLNGVNENRFAALSEDIRISNFRFIDSDASDGEVEFTFDALKPVHLKGNINDAQIQNVLTYAMLNEQNPG